MSHATLVRTRRLGGGGEGLLEMIDAMIDDRSPLAHSMRFPLTDATRSSRNRIDIHSHGIARQLPDMSVRYGGAWPQIIETGALTAKLTVGSAHRAIDSRSWDSSRRIEDMELEGVSKQVICPIPLTFCYDLPIEGASYLCHVQNEWLAEVVSSASGRFVGLGTLPLQAPEAAARMVEEIMSSSQLRGVEIGTGVAGQPLDNPALDIVFAACADTGAVVLIHPTREEADEQLRRYGLIYSVGMPAETAVAAAALVMGGVMDRHPTLTVILAHGGGAFLWLLPRIDRCWEILPDAQARSQRPSTYAPRFFYDSLIYGSKHVAQLVSQVGADRVMMGTDYPTAIAERPAGIAVDTSGLPSADVDRVLFKNAEEVLGLS